MKTPTLHTAPACTALHSFSLGMAAPLMLFSPCVQAAPAVPMMIEMPQGTVRARLAQDWRKVGAAFGVAIARHERQHGQG